MASLPPEIIIEILHHLDSGKDLKSCMLLSKEIRELIISTSSLMRKVNVRVKDSNFNEIVPFISRYGPKIVNLQVVEVKFENEKNFMNFLMMAPNIECLEIKECHFEDESLDSDLSDSETQLAKKRKIDFESILDEMSNFELKKLTKLITNSISARMHHALLRILRNKTNLKNLQAGLVNEEGLDVKYAQILSQQHKLESLSIFTICSPFLINILDMLEAKTLDFRLKKFQTDEQLVWNENLFRFLEGQSSTLEELKISNCRIDERYLRMILKKFINLKMLTLTVLSKFSDEMIMEIESNRLNSVHTLRMMVCDGRHQETFKTFMKVFPNIKKLQLGELMPINRSNFYDVLSELPYLSSLEIYEFSNQKIRLPNLKSLQICNLVLTKSNPSWENLLKNCNNIEELIIEDIDGLVFKDRRSEHTALSSYGRLFDSLDILGNLELFQFELLESLHNDITEDEEKRAYKVELKVCDRVLKISKHVRAFENAAIDKLRKKFSDFNILEKV